jgi:hypothetical protein
LLKGSFAAGVAPPREHERRRQVARIVAGSALIEEV